jgi:tetratricopeptide (TPR) repeat protein
MFNPVSYRVQCEKRGVHTKTTRDPKLHVGDAAQIVIFFLNADCQYSVHLTSQRECRDFNTEPFKSGYSLFQMLPGCWRHAVVRSLFLLLLFCPALVAQQKLNVQVSDAEDHPVKGLRITTKSPGSTETTDNSGKATITFTPVQGLIPLVIVSPPDWDFISPWQRSVTVPPDFWSIVVVPRGQREILEHPHVVKALAARANALQGRRSTEDFPPTAETRRRAVETVAAEVGLMPGDVDRKIEGLAVSDDIYSRALGRLYEHSYRDAAELFSRALEEAEGESDPSARVERGSSAAFFLGQALFEEGRFQESAQAYKRAAELRPNDPIILNNEGLSLSKAGDYKGAQELYERALQLLNKSGLSKSIDFSTTTNNLAALLAYRNDLEAADALFEKALDLRRELLPPNDIRIATSLNNVAAMKLVKGDCDSAKVLLNEALRIQQESANASLTRGRVMEQRTITPVDVMPKCLPSGECQVSAAGGAAIAASTPGIATTMTNLAMASFCQRKFDQAQRTLGAVLSIQESEPRIKSELGTTYLDLGRVAEAQKKWDEALKDYKKAISVYEKTLGISHPVLVRALIYSGELLEKLKQTDEARTALERALKIEAETFGSESDSAREVRAKLNSLGRNQ